MSKTTDKSFKAKLLKFLAMEGANASVEVFTDTNDVITFPDLAEGDTPKVGDKATIGGQAATGEHKLADGTVYVFDNGELTEIREPEDDDDDNDRVTELESEISALKTELEEVKALKTELKDFKAKYAALKGLVSEYVVEDKDNKDKSREEKDEKKGLSAAINKRKNLKNK